MKNEEVNDFIEVRDNDVIEDKAVLEFFTEESDVRILAAKSYLYVHVARFARFFSTSFS